MNSSNINPDHVSCVTSLDTHLVIAPYQFKHTEMSINNNSENRESDFDDNQVCFTDRLGHTPWYSHTKCSLMPRAVECFAAKN